MVSDALVPWRIFKYALAVHVDPRFFKTENPTCGEVDTGVVKVVANRDESAAVLQRTNLPNVLHRVHL